MAQRIDLQVQDLINKLGQRCKRLLQKSDQAINPDLVRSIADGLGQLAGGVPLLTQAVQILAFIMHCAADAFQNDEKLEEIKRSVDLLRRNMETLAPHGGMTQRLLEEAVAKLYAEALCLHHTNNKRQSCAIGFCNLLCAQSIKATLDGLALRLQHLNQELNTILLHMVPKLAPRLSRSESSIIEGKEKLLDFLSLGKSMIRVLSICGMGGIGKTTLLKALYHEIRTSNKHAMAFVEVGIGPIKPLEEIQQQISFQLEQHAQIFSDNQQGQDKLEECFKKMKDKGIGLCLCIDNVWKWEHLQKLLPENMYETLPSSSILMLSTRSSDVEYKFKVMCSRNEDEEYMLYKPRTLRENEAQNLFQRMAEKSGRQLQATDDEMLHRIVPLCGGLPLALKLYGSYFQHAERRRQWQIVERRIKEARGSPNNTDDSDGVFQTLEASLAFQRPHVLDAFLDVALFWHGELIEVVRDSLVDDNGEDLLECLLQDSLVEVDDARCHCHDLFVAIAQKMAKERGWIYYKHIQDIPLNTTNIRGIWLKQTHGVLPTMPLLHYLISDVPTSINYEELVHLKFLKVPQSHVYQCPPNLRVLQLRDVRTFTNINKLVRILVLDLSGSAHLTLLPSSLCNFSSLKVLRITCCAQLTSLPTCLGKLSSLEVLDLSYCYKLTSLPNSLCQLFLLKKLILFDCAQLLSLPTAFGDLFSLQLLDLSYCTQISSLPDSICNLKLLRELDLFDCSQLTSLPTLLGKLSSLCMLGLSGCTKLKSLPTSLSAAFLLGELDLSNCEELISIPGSFNGLSSLSVLNLSNCIQLASLPNSLGSFYSLKELILLDCSKLINLPTSLDGLSSLWMLNVSGCTQLVELPASIGGLRSLEVLVLSYCSKLISLPDTIGDLFSLKELVLSDCTLLTSIPTTIGKLYKLRVLNLSRCIELKILPGTIGNLPSLWELDISGCGQIVTLPNTIGNLPSLWELDLSGCGQLMSLPNSINGIASLLILRLSSCVKLTILPNSLSNFTSLKELNLSGWEHLVSFPTSFESLLSLEVLNLSNCIQLISLPESLGNFSLLRKLDVSGCVQLTTLPASIGCLSLLQVLNLSGCVQLMSLPESLNKVSSLQVLDLSSCTKVTSFPKIPGIQHLYLPIVEQDQIISASFVDNSSLHERYLDALAQLELEPLFS